MRMRFVGGFYLGLLVWAVLSFHVAMGMLRGVITAAWLMTPENNVLFMGIIVWSLALCFMWMFAKFFYWGLAGLVVSIEEDSVKFRKEWRRRRKGVLK